MQNSGIIKLLTIGARYKTGSLGLLFFWLPRVSRSLASLSLKEREYE